MATGCDDEDALLGINHGSLTEGQNEQSLALVKALKPCFGEIQNTLSCLASNMDKMGQAWAALATQNDPKGTAQQGQPTNKRKFADLESDNELDYEDSDMEPDDDVVSLLKSVKSGQSTANSGTGDDNDSPLLSEIDASFDDDDVGPEITPKLASIANKAFSKTVPIDSIKKKQESYSRPKNCDKVVVPKVNKEIWRKMSVGVTKKRDLRLMNIQKAVTKSSFAVCKIAEVLLKPDIKEEQDSMIRTCTDVLSLLGHANTAISLHRRDLLKPVLKGDSSLCDSNVPVTSFLFGDDLPKSLKEVRQASNLGRDYGSKNWRPRGGSSYRGKPQFFRKNYPEKQNQKKK